MDGKNKKKNLKMHIPLRKSLCGARTKKFEELDKKKITVCKDHTVRVKLLKIIQMLFKLIKFILFTSVKELLSHNACDVNT